MRTDQAIQEDVEQELQWDPDLDAINIAVSVKDGVVTLAGMVNDNSDRIAAENVASSVDGVVRVNNNLQIKNRY